MERAQNSGLQKLLHKIQGQTPTSGKQLQNLSAARRLVDTDDKSGHAELAMSKQNHCKHNWEGNGCDIEVLKACDRDQPTSSHDQRTPLMGVLTTLPLINEHQK